MTRKKELPKLLQGVASCVDKAYTFISQNKTYLDVVSYCRDELEAVVETVVWLPNSKGCSEVILLRFKNKTGIKITRFINLQQELVSIGYKTLEEGER